MTDSIVTDSASGVDGGTAQGPGSAVVAQNVHFGTLSFGNNVTHHTGLIPGLIP